MSSNKITDDVITERMGIIRAGINRFYSEGFYNWSRFTFENALDLEIDLEDPRVQKTLHEWEAIGVIELVGEDRCYFRVLYEFPNES